MVEEEVLDDTLLLEEIRRCPGKYFTQYLYGNFFCFFLFYAKRRKFSLRNDANLNAEKSGKYLKF